METTQPESEQGPSAQGQLSRTMRIDITPEALPGKTPAFTTGTAPRRPTIRITRPKSSTGKIGDSDFQQLLQNVYDGAVITDYSGRVADANVRLCHFLGYEHEELCRMGLFDLLYGADETLLPVIRENLANTRFVLLQAFFVRKDGSVFPAETAINHLYLSGQDYLCFFVRDITLRREAEEQLRTEHTAIQTAENGIAIADVEARLTYVNPAILRLWGLKDLEAAQTLTLHQLFSDDTVGNTIVQNVAIGQNWSGEVKARRLDGTLFYVQTSATANLNADDELVGVVLSFNDVTERKRAEAQREQYAEQLSIRNAEMVADLDMAREVQLALLPRQFPVFPASATSEQSLLRFSHFYRPSTTLGGDFFYILPLSDYVAGVFTCDVMGHGMRAALITAIMRGLVEELKPVARDPGIFMTQMNREFMTILRDAEEFMFVSASYVLIDLRERRVAFTDAGHPSPLLFQRSKGLVTPLRSTPAPAGPALGIIEKSFYTTQFASVGQDDAVLIYTDGISEVEGPQREEYGTERLIQCARKHLASPMASILTELATDAEKFAAGKGFEDDVCLVAAEIIGLPGQAT
jgi:sigma-B regulation protein RsbU (phosphoserine phosphatase)